MSVPLHRELISDVSTRAGQTSHVVSGWRLLTNHKEYVSAQTFPERAWVTNQKAKNFLFSMLPSFRAQLKAVTGQEASPSIFPQTCNHLGRKSLQNNFLTKTRMHEVNNKVVTDLHYKSSCAPLPCNAWSTFRSKIWFCFNISWILI